MDKNFSSTPSTILRLLINSIMNLHSNVIFSWNNLTRIKDGAYVINLDEKKK